MMLKNDLSGNESNKFPWIEWWWNFLTIMDINIHQSTAEKKNQINDKFLDNPCTKDINLQKV